MIVRSAVRENRVVARGSKLVIQGSALKMTRPSFVPRWASRTRNLPRGGVSEERFFHKSWGFKRGKSKIPSNRGLRYVEVCETRSEKGDWKQKRRRRGLEKIGLFLLAWGISESKGVESEVEGKGRGRESWAGEPCHRMDWIPARE